MISTSDGDITYMGKVMANLPLEPPMSKLIYFGYIFNILNESIIMGKYIYFVKNKNCAVVKLCL